MDLMDTTDIKAHFFFYLTEGLCKWKFHIFMDIFTLSWIFFPLPRLIQGRMPDFLHKTDLEGLYFAVDLGVLQKNGCSGAFVEPKSEE